MRNIYVFSFCLCKYVFLIKVDEKNLWSFLCWCVLLICVSDLNAQLYLLLSRCANTQCTSFFFSLLVQTGSTAEVHKQQIQTDLLYLAI